MDINDKLEELISEFNYGLIISAEHGEINNEDDWTMYLNDFIYTSTIYRKECREILLYNEDYLLGLAGDWDRPRSIEEAAHNCLFDVLLKYGEKLSGK